jgi:hypothetical protein
MSSTAAGVGSRAQRISSWRGTVRPLARDSLAGLMAETGEPVSPQALDTARQSGVGSARSVGIYPRDVAWVGEFHSYV